MLDECLSDGHGVLRLAGLPSRQESVRFWEEASGYSAANLPYYEVYAAWRLAYVMARIGTIFRQRGLIAPDDDMDIRNGSSVLLARHAACLGFLEGQIMTRSLGPLVSADEYCTHQIVETHASVLHSVPAWTEKVWGAFCARDGSLAVSLGFGKYVNRNVVDGIGGVSRSVEQWTVRASRSLSSSVDDIDVGPLEYESLEPLKQDRVRLQPNSTQPISFELRLNGITPCVCEEREDRRTLSSYRRSADQIRYHQVGAVSGWIVIAGQRVEVNERAWMMARDRSWGVRPSVGVPLQGLEPEPMDVNPPRVLAIWCPVLFAGNPAALYAFMQYYLLYEGSGWRYEKVQGAFEFPDGRRVAVARIEPDVRFDPANKRLLEAQFALTMQDGSSCLLRVKQLCNTGFHLGAGLYHGFQGRYHGEWRGHLATDGEYIADCSTADNSVRLNQFRDCVIEMRDMQAGATGIGVCQTWVQG